MEGHMEHENKKEKMCKMMEECCAGMSADDRQEMMGMMMGAMGREAKGGMMGMMMGHCMRAFRWLPLIPLILGVILFALGYFPSAEVVRVLWLVISGFIILMGLFGFIMVRAMGRV